MNLASFIAFPADLCASVRVRLICVAVGVLGSNYPRGNRSGGTSSLAEGVLEVFTSNEQRGSHADAAFGDGTPEGEKTLHSSTRLSLGR